MKHQHFRRVALLSLPLALGALLGGVKWKQLHPTPTRLDLQERAFLGKVEKVEIQNNTYHGEIPVREFKESLNDFYLIDDNKSKPNSVVTPYGQTIFVVTVKPSANVDRSWIMIGISPVGYYQTLHNFSPQQTRSFWPLHPVTQRRLKKLAEENMSAH